MASDSPQAASPRKAEPEQSTPADDASDLKQEPTENENDSKSTSPKGDNDDNSKRDSSSPESGEASSIGSPAPADARDDNPTSSTDAPPLPNEAPPLPAGVPPATQDDGWDFQWDPTAQAYYFYNRITGASQWDNPRIPTAGGATPAAAPGAPGTTASASATLSGPPPLPKNDAPPAGGYNPAIHGDYDPNAWYAKGSAADEDETAQTSASAINGGEYGAMAQFNRFTGQFQTLDDGPDRHTDEAKSRRQMNAFFDVDAAANSHNGRSLKAERSGKKPSKSELKQFKEKRRAKKEEKRRAWLRD
ncbi:WW domain-containing protein [Colletotrichum abscissum]|uniref:WW domain-containing protein n=1 Tax=Colletotrichum abscissum TaxID=1671311 RepID=A0A9P9X5R1_9PEZI|nr:WW domain-containing protein [Colletotrichum abscissum]KAI3537737.1 WW domain-containing protein [Colletotrichum abscissum]KAK1474312.1 WW domain-containing protein [Colletotrichum abscissum]